MRNLYNPWYSWQAIQDESFTETEFLMCSVSSYASGSEIYILQIWTYNTENFLLQTWKFDERKWGWVPRKAGGFNQTNIKAREAKPETAT